MQEYILTRGTKNWVDQFITELQGKYVPWGAPENGIQKFAQVNVKPIQLWEIVFPKEYYDIMNNTIFGKNTHFGNIHGSKLALAAAGLRKLLGAKKLPAYKQDSFMPITNNFVSIMGIGMKDDAVVNGIEQI